MPSRRNWVALAFIHHVTVGSVMLRKARVIFPSKKVERELFKQLATEQTRRLIAYAEQEIERIGNDISAYQDANHLDRTGNLLDSLCWVVCYEGKVKKSGYYRAQEAVEESHLHEFSRPMGEDVMGRLRASQFISSYQPTITRGWEVAFAILAPYWGYWEEGFSMPYGTKKPQWQVMTRHYDVVKKDLSPSKVKFHNYIPS